MGQRVYFSSPNRLQPITLGKPQQQEQRTSGHITPTVRGRETRNASCLVLSKFSLLHSLRPKSTVLSIADWVFEATSFPVIKIIPHQHCHRPTGSGPSLLETLPLWSRTGCIKLTFKTHEHITLNEFIDVFLWLIT